MEIQFSKLFLKSDLFQKQNQNFWLRPGEFKIKNNMNKKKVTD